MDNEKEAKDAVEDMKEAVGEMVEKIE